jgi:hypothetical protein
MARPDVLRFFDSELQKSIPDSPLRGEVIKTLQNMAADPALAKHVTPETLALAADPKTIPQFYDAIQNTQVFNNLIPMVEAKVAPTVADRAALESFNVARNFFLGKNAKPPTTPPVFAAAPYQQPAAPATGQPLPAGAITRANALPAIQRGLTAALQDPDVKNKMYLMGAGALGGLGLGLAGGYGLGHAIAPDDAELTYEARLARERRRNLLMSLTALAGAGGLGYAAWQHGRQ